MFTHCKLLPPATKLGQGNIFRSVYQEFCSWGVSRPSPKGEVEGSGWGGVSRPTPKGEVEGFGRGASRPTPGGGEVEGSGWEGVLQAHTWGVSKPRPRGCIPACTEADTPPKQMATAAGSMHPTGMHSCFLSNRALLVTELVSVQMIVFGLR